MVIIFWSIIGLMVIVAMSLVAKPLLMQHESGAKKNLRSSKLGVIILLLLLPASALLLYQHWGASRALMHYWVLKKEAREVKAELAKIKNPQVIINQLIVHLQRYPNSPRGWYLLGRIYLGEYHYAKAHQALTKAYQLKPQDPEYAVAYAQGVFFYNKRRLTQAAIAALKKVLKQHPNYVPAINLLAVNAYVNQQYQSAVNYWQRLIPLFAEGSSDQQVVLKMISRAQKRMAASSQ